MTWIPLLTFTLGILFAILAVVWAFTRDENRQRARKPFWPRPPKPHRPSWLHMPRLRRQKQTNNHPIDCLCTLCITSRELEANARTSMNQLVRDVVAQELHPLPKHLRDGGRLHYYCTQPGHNWITCVRDRSEHALYHPECEADWEHRHYR